MKLPVIKADGLYRQAVRAELEWETTGDPALSTGYAFDAAAVDWRQVIVARPLIAHFSGPVDPEIESHGYRLADRSLMRWSAAPPMVEWPAGLTLVPARSAVTAFRRLAEVAGESADSAEAHLDDPRFDAWIALLAGRPVARYGLLSAGDSATLRMVFVDPADRRKGVGTAVLRRTYESAQRCGYRHVLVATTATIFAGRMGFEPVGTFSIYRRQDDTEA